MLRSFKTSQCLFEQGDEADTVLRVVEGTVEVVRRIGRAQVLIDTIEAGGFVGAMGPLLGQKRRATAQAVSEVTVEALSREEYLHHIRRDPDAAEAALERAGARLRGSDDALLEAIRAELDGAVQPRPRTDQGAPAAAGTSPAPAGAPALHIQAASDSLVALIGEAPIPIARLPYMVGRKAGEQEEALIVEPDLALDEPPPHHLSRRHFLIFARDDGICVRDLDSTLGTTVNGESIGRKFNRNVVALAPGENRIAAGDAHSSYVFLVGVE